MPDKRLTHLFFTLSLLYLLIVNHIQFPVTTVLKPLPIFVLIFWALKGMDLSLKWRYLLSALVLCAAGDIALTFESQIAFLVGLSLFLIAHLFYSAMFFSQLRLNFLRAVSVLVVLSVAVLMFQLLAPHLGMMHKPVVVYMGVISLMVIVAILSDDSPRYSKLGAVMFMLSDVVLSVQLFLHPTRNLTVVVMVSYYMAQYLILYGLADRAVEELLAKDN